MFEGDENEFVNLVNRVSILKNIINESIFKNAPTLLYISPSQYMILLSKSCSRNEKLLQVEHCNRKYALQYKIS